MAGGRAGGAAGGGFAGGSFGGGGGFAGGSFGGGGGFAGGSFGGGGGFAGGSFGGGGGFAGGFGGGAFAGGFAGGGAFAGGFAGGSFGGGGGFAGGFGGGAFGGGFAGGGAFAGGFAGGSFGGGGGFAGGFGGGAFGGGFAGGGAFAGGFAGGSFGGGGGFAGGFGGGAFGGGFAGGTAGGPGESCGAPIVLTVPSTVSGSTRFATADHEFAQQTPCRRTGVGGADVVYGFIVPPQRTVAVNLTPAGWDAVINLVSDPSLCGSPGNPGRTCLAGADDPERASYTNSSPFPATVYLVVGGFTSAARGDFTLSLSLIDGDRCEGPVTIPGNTMLPNEALGAFTDDYRGAGSNCASRSLGPDRVYRVSVPPQTALTVQAAPVGIDTSISFSLSAPQCTSRQCAAPSGDTVGVGAIDRATYSNPSLQTVDVLVIIDAAAQTTTGTFALTTALGPIMVAGDTCASPTLLAPGTFLPNESLSGFQDNASFGVGCDLRVGPDRVYAIDIGGFTELTVRVTPTVMGFSPTISIASSLAACDTPSCVSVGVGGEARVSNFATTPNRYYIIVDGIVGSTGSSFSLATAIAPIASFDAGVVDAGTRTDAGMAFGETCFSPDVLTFGVPVALPLNSAQNDTNGASMTCAYGPGPDRTFAVSIPPMQRLTVIASPQGPFDLSLSFAADAMSCAAGICLASVNASTASGTETFTFDNTSTVTRSGVLVMDSMTLASGSVGYFASLTNLTSTGDTCLNAIPIAGSQTLVGQTTNGFMKDYTLMNPPCVAPLGPEVVYSVTLAPMQTLTVVMNSMQDAALNIVAGPASACATATTCLAGADTGGSGAETATYTNGSTASQTVFVMLARWGSATGTLTYDASFTLTP